MILVRVEVPNQHFTAALPEEAGSGDRRDRQQADTEDANGDPPWWSVRYNLMNESRGNFPATAGVTVTSRTYGKSGR
jgi:hypothetical protein